MKDLNKGLCGEKICWRITRKCNLSCDFCLAGDSDRYSNEIDTNQALIFLRVLKNHNVNKICFSGGEPLLREDLATLISACTKFRIFTTVSTNGTLLSKTWGNILCNPYIVTKVSLHGPKEIHDSLIGAKIYDKVFSSLKYLSKIGVKIGINCLLSSKNVKFIRYLLSEIRCLNLDHVLFQFLIFRERAKSLKDMYLSKEQKEEVINNIYSWATELGCKFKIKYNDYTNKKISYLILENNGTLIIANDYLSRDIDIGICSELTLTQALYYLCQEDQKKDAWVEESNGDRQETCKVCATRLAYSRGFEPLTNKV